MTVASLLVEPPTADVVNIARECVDQMTQDILGFQDAYTQLLAKLWEAVNIKKVTQVARG